MNEIETCFEKELPNIGDKSRKELDISSSDDVRVKMGLFYTNKEWEKYRKKTLKKKLK